MSNGVHAFTGHRPAKLGGYSPNARKRLVAFAMEVVAEADTDIAIVGMALGWDQAVAEACIALDIPFVAAIPFKGQESRWPAHSQEHYRRLMDAAQDVKLVQDEVPATHNRAAAFLDMRNMWMVNNSSHLHALWDGLPTGGTANCVAYAAIQQRPFTNHWDRWSNPFKDMFEDLLG